MMVINNKFEYGQIVYLKTDTDQSPHIVTAFIVTGDIVTYQLSCGSYETVHTEVEISEEKNVLISSE